MDAFYASVEQLRRPELRGKPVIVGHDGPRGVVAAASYEARRFGIRSAMPSATARRLCPTLIAVPADFNAYREASARVFSVLRDYTPIIEPLALDEAYLDLSGSRQARHQPQALAEQLKAEVFRSTGGLTASVGVAAAKVVAKIASDLRKPDGLVVVWPGTEATFLAPLALRVLPGLGPATERRLDGLGLKTVGDIALAAEGVLRDRLGSYGPTLKALARGDDPRAVAVPGMPKSISREVTFEQDVLDSAALRRTVRSLAQDVTQSLRRRRLWARVVRLKVRFQGFETHTFQATLPVATDLDTDVLTTADRLLAQALDQSRPVRLMGIGVAGLSEAHQDGLFDKERSRQRALDGALDQLRQRFGPRAVLRGRPVHTEQRDFRRDDLDQASTE